MISVLVWRNNKKVPLALGLIVLAWYLAPFSVQAFMGIGGYWSEKVVQRQGAGASNLVVGRQGVSGDLQLVMGPVVTTSPASHTVGIRSTILQGALSSLNGFPNARVWFEWGYTPAYEQGVVNAQIVSVVGTYEFDLGGTDADFGRSIYYRFAGETDGIAYGQSQVIPAGSTPGWYRLTQVLPFVFLVVSILLVVGLVGAGLPLAYAVMLGGILAVVGAVGSEVIVGALVALF